MDKCIYVMEIKLHVYLLLCTDISSWKFWFGYVGSLIEYQLKLYEVYLIYTVQISVEL